MVEIIDITKDMTLGEIGARDLDNWNLVHKSCKKFFFNHPNAAFAFMGKCVNAAMNKFGIDQLEMAAHARNTNPVNEFKTILERDISKKMEEAGLKVERREYEGEDVQRSGVYIYHGNEIAYYISEIIAAKRGQSGSRLVLPRNKIKFAIHTNVPMN